MLNIIRQFQRDEDGAVTVEWVVLTAGIVLMAIIVMNIITAGATTFATGIADDLSSM